MSGSAKKLRERVKEAIARRDELAAELASPEVVGDPDRLREVGQEHAALEEIA
ncbi:MAG: peptide chain release factor 1, partial [Actinobacteria bacterium]|nr:peptide chain release factor 1 [Actinomycetota bacterium]NIU19674.1 peptide chain release factor 1 [Actinomycetota bacterium]NIV58201.1 peptide chain release factor 1 [Actinomycetota bacterium]NIX20032.1 peptide chain release factor 1 [Actinomycetota bacterium]NIX53012.1 peptide chain release factor 1 [Actinomycetota bacterium]